MAEGAKTGTISSREDSVVKTNKLQSLSQFFKRVSNKTRRPFIGLAKLITEKIITAHHAGTGNGIRDGFGALGLYILILIPLLATHAIVAFPIVLPELVTKLLADYSQGKTPKSEPCTLFPFLDYLDPEENK
jgi:hypothetical protein